MENNEAYLRNDIAWFYSPDGLAELGHGVK